MTQPPELAVIGYTVLDMENDVTRPGGGGYFAAMAASLIGDVGFVTRIGADYDTAHFRHRLRPEGIVVDHDLPTTSAHLEYAFGDATVRKITLNLAVSALLSGSEIPISWMNGLKIVHLSTMIPSQQHAVLEFVRSHCPGASIALDSDLCFLGERNQKKQVIHSYENTDIAFVNRREYAMLKDTIDQVPLAVVKIDKDGAYAMRKGKVVAYQESIPVDAVDPTGAGDILAGTFLACLIQDAPIMESLSEAVYRATQSVTQPGINHLFEENV